MADAHLQRIDQVNPALNAVAQSAADRVRAEAREDDEALARGEVKGPLHSWSRPTRVDIPLHPRYKETVVFHDNLAGRVDIGAPAVRRTRWAKKPSL